MDITSILTYSALHVFQVQYVGVESMLHMTCVGSSKESISHYLDKARKMGLRNVLALRGDLPNIDEEWVVDPDKFNFATDLVRHIRAEHEDYFTVCVAGYPTGHPDADSYEVEFNNSDINVYTSIFTIFGEGFGQGSDVIKLPFIIQ